MVGFAASPNAQLDEQLTEQLAEQLRVVKQLEEQLRRSGSANRGGQFEWVDSVLVKALRAGHWLLIDNINFCR